MKEEAKMDIRTYVQLVYQQAQLLGACELFTGCEDLDALMQLFFSVNGQEFCLANSFPMLPTFRLLKPHGVERYGLYIDAGRLTLDNPERVALVGRTQAVINCNKLCRNTISLYHGATATVNADGWAVVVVEGTPGTRYVKHVSGHAVLFEKGRRTRKYHTC